MITATLILAVQKSTYWKMEIEYNDEGVIAVDTFNFSGGTVERLINRAQSKVAQHEQTKSFDFSTLIGKSIDVTPVEPDPPTQDEIDENAWFADWHQYQEVKKLLDDLPALANTGRIAFRDGLQASCEDNWKDSYLGKT